MNPTIDVITPCYNSAAFIKECIDSVRASVTLEKFIVNHIVVDDGSTDESQKILEEINLPHLAKILLPKNSGHAAARNEGLKVAKGDYVFFLDADDILFQNSLRYLYDFAQGQNREWVYGDFVRGDKDANYLIGKDYYGWDFATREELLTAMYSGGHFFQQNSLFARRILINVGGFDTELSRAVDFDLCTRLLIEGRAPIYLRGPLYLHRFHDDNLSHGHKADADLHRKQVSALFKRHESKLQAILSKKDISNICLFLS